MRKITIIGILFYSWTLGAQTWNPVGTGMNDHVLCLAADTLNNFLYAGGKFTFAGGNSVNFIAKWNGTNWTDLEGGTNGPVYAILVDGNDLYVGGEFTMAGGVSANNIAKWDGFNWSRLSIGMNNKVRTLLKMDNEIVAGGDFTTASNATVNFIAKWDGSSWSSIGGGTDGPWVYDLLLDNGFLYACGFFLSAGGVSARNLARWNGFTLV